MITNYSILIIEDHQIIFEGYKNIINSLSTNQEYEFILDYASSCEVAIEKVMQSKNKVYDLVFLDINLPSSNKYGVNSGKELGVWLREFHPDIKIIVITSYRDNFMINAILKNVNPNAFLLKDEMKSRDLTIALKNVIEEKLYYTSKISEVVRNKVSSNLDMDEFDFEILREISYGTKSSEISNYIGLSKIAVYKRKQKLKTLFNVTSGKDRDLIIRARLKGYI